MEAGGRGVRYGIAFSASGVRALVADGRAQVLAPRGVAAAQAAATTGLPVVPADEGLSAETAEAVDRAAIAVARGWRPGPLGPGLETFELGLLAEYDLLYLAGRVLRLAAALHALDDARELIVAAPAGSPEALVAQAIGRSRDLPVRLLELPAEAISPLDIAARAADRPAPLTRRLAKYALARLGTLGRTSGRRVAAYVWGEAGPLLYPLIARGAVRLVLDPTEPPPRGVYRRGLLRGARWAAVPVRPTPGPEPLPAGPFLAWGGSDLSGALARAMTLVIAPQVNLWRRYAEDLPRAWRRARIEAVVLAHDAGAIGRIRALAAEGLKIPSIVVQHGVLAWIADRNHEVADYSAVWGPVVVDDFAARGIERARAEVVGWPQGIEHLEEARRLRQAGAGDYALILTTTLAVQTAVVPEDAIERQARAAIAAIREGGWTGPVIAKLHPAQSVEQYRALFAALGHPDVTVLGHHTDTWPLMARARFAMTVSTSIASALPYLRCPAIVDEPTRPSYAPYLTRFAEFPDVGAREPSSAEVARILRGRPTPGASAGQRVVDYATVPADGADRLAALLDRACRGGPVSPGASRRALDVSRAPAVAFDRLPRR